MSYVLGLLLPVLAYGALCACFGAWVHATIRNHWKH